MGMSQWLVSRVNTGGFLALGQGFMEGWGCEVAQRRMGPEEPPTSRGSHLYLYPGGRGLGISFYREAGGPRLIPQVPALPPSPGSSIQGHPKAGLGGQAFLSFRSQVNTSLASSSPSVRIRGPLLVLMSSPGASAFPWTCPFQWAPPPSAGSSERCK